jgi:hypothetical protein
LRLTEPKKIVASFVLGCQPNTPKSGQDIRRTLDV